MAPPLQVNQPNSVLVPGMPMCSLPLPIAICPQITQIDADMIASSQTTVNLPRFDGHQE